jgi:hypothetical protein
MRGIKRRTPLAGVCYMLIFYLCYDVSCVPDKKCEIYRVTTSLGSLVFVVAE